MYHCLLPVDRDEKRTPAQADYLIDLPIDSQNLAVTILYVVPREGAAIEDEASFEGNESALRAANRLAGYDMQVQRRVVAGTPISSKITELAASIEADQIVMAGRKRSTVTKVLIGSTTEAVMGETDRPVVLVG